MIIGKPLRQRRLQKHSLKAEEKNIEFRAAQKQPELCKEKYEPIFTLMISCKGLPQLTQSNPETKEGMILTRIEVGG